MLVCLAPLAAAMLVSGLDDLVVDLVWIGLWIRDRLFPRARIFPPGPRQVESAPRRRIAILVPLWQEQDVVGRMLEHNLAAIRYPDYHIFAGAYPNDEATQRMVRAMADRFPKVHLALCPHDGPTSKADCLNWIYQHLGLYEEQSGERFELVVTHDAEDLIHPEELSWINFYSSRFDFIQTPVLALATPLTALTHGVYCDEFAESHTRDMTVRPRMGGFVPSAGVGTGYRREALEKLAGAESNRIFEPDALTEDYENGLRLFRLGCSQGFLPITRADTGKSRNFVATREFFPQHWRSALDQRTRWAMGIVLQSWERHGWGGKPGEVYWLWRDRKGMLANPLSLALLRSRDVSVDALFAARRAAGGGDAGTADFQDGDPHGVRCASLWNRVRAGCSGARGVWQPLEHRGSSSSSGTIRDRAGAGAAVEVGQDRARLSVARRAAGTQAKAR